MGWCSGTEIFDMVCSVLLDKTERSKKEILKSLIEALDNRDWDCHGDSAYWDHPLVQEIFKEMYPEWFEKE